MKQHNFILKKLEVGLSLKVGLRAGQYCVAEFDTPRYEDRSRGYGQCAMGSRPVSAIAGAESGDAR